MCGADVPEGGVASILGAEAAADVGGCCAPDLLLKVAATCAANWAAI